jgi:hypothetical protein
MISKRSSITSVFPIWGHKLLVFVVYPLLIWPQCSLNAKVGTRYFFLSPLPLVRYLEIVLPLRAGPLFSKNF